MSIDNVRKSRYFEARLLGDTYRRLAAAGVSMRANDNVAEYITQADQYEARANIEVLTAQILEELLIDWRNDPNTKETPKRFAKMLVDEVMRGRFQPPPACTTFPNTRHLDEMYTTGPITVNSMCSHHLVPITGRAWVGVIPGDAVIGLSKFNRLVQWVCRRPQIQEEMVVQVADTLHSRLQAPKGLAVVIEANHMCMTWRGVEEPSSAVMRTNVLLGKFREDAAARAEFFAAVK